VGRPDPQNGSPTGFRGFQGLLRRGGRGFGSPRRKKKLGETGRGTGGRHGSTAFAAGKLLRAATTRGGSAWSAAGGTIGSPENGSTATHPRRLPVAAIPAQPGDYPRYGRAAGRGRRVCFWGGESESPAGGNIDGFSLGRDRGVFESRDSEGPGDLQTVG